jgi:hypothetical protein
MTRYVFTTQVGGELMEFTKDFMAESKVFPEQGACL